MWPEYRPEDQNWKSEASSSQRRLPEDSHHLQALWQTHQAQASSRIKEEEKGRQEAGEDAGLKDATFRGPGKEHQQTGLVNYYIYTYRSLFIQQLSVA